MLRTFLFLSLLISFSVLNATILDVPAEYPTIQSAIDAAASGDTVLVAPGQYTESIDYKWKAIRLRSSGGPEVTTLTGQILMQVSGAVGAEFLGFRVESSSENPVMVVDGTPPLLIEGNIFNDNIGLPTVISSTGANVLIRRNLFHHNSVGSACIGVFGGSKTLIINNTFDHNSRGFFSLSSATVAKNNIVTNSDVYGIYGYYEELSYNDVWNNNPDYLDATQPWTTISVDPLYLDPGSFDYRLEAVSPCIDAGDPAEEYNDPDGSRADIGIFAIPLAYPAAFQIRVGSAVNQRVPEVLPLIAWRYLDTLLAAQAAYEVEVGTDRDWAVAERWATGEVTSSDTTVMYSGAPLVEGSSYWARIRVKSELNWGSWNVIPFRMNQTPSAPVPISPTMGIESSPTGTRLKVNNAIDLDNDGLIHTFEAYADAGLTQLVSSSSGIALSAVVTQSLVTAALESGRFYWWRCRASDTYEYGPWSSTAFFFTSTPKTLLVPETYLSIQEAIDAGADGDTVSVAPGVYFESLVFNGSNVKVVSREGPSATLLRKPVDDPVSLPQVLFYHGATKQAEISGFTFRFDYSEFCINVRDSSSPVIRNNVFENLNSAVISIGGGAPLITRNLFINNRYAGVLCNPAANAEIINNTFAGNNSGIISWSSATVALNNIIMGSREVGISGTFAVHDYNDVFGNHSNYVNCSPAPHEIAVDPLFVDFQSHDFRLLPGSPAIDAGSPLPAFSDPDGSRNDLGFQPFQDFMPGTTNVRVGPADQFCVPGSTPLVSWIYIDQGASEQTGYEIEIGLDRDWAVVEMWQPGIATSTATSIAYGGAILLDGKVYFGRIRVENQSDWGPWNDFSFRANYQPTPPGLRHPIAGEITPAVETRLSVSRSIDRDFDSLHYEFQVYSDSLLTVLVETIEGGPYGIVDSISSARLTNLIAGQQYWWRARSDDGSEYSNWSQIGVFVARGGMALYVPSPFPTIGAAVKAARSGDTVLVAPGTYTEAIEFGTKEIVVTSVGGPAVTQLNPVNSRIATISQGNSHQTELSGFSVRSNSLDPGIMIQGGASPTIKNMHFADNYSYKAVVYVLDGSPVIKNNVFFSNQGEAAVGVAAGSPHIINNTFVQNYRGIYSHTSEPVIRNNIIVGSAHYGLFGYCNRTDYNDIWNNTVNYTSGAADAGHDISFDPQFRSLGDADFRLLSASPCIDAGDPDPQFNDPDGTRNDIGAIPFVLALPAIFELSAPQSQLLTALIDRNPTFSWSESTLPPDNGTVSYTLFVAADSLFAFVQVDDSLTTNSAHLPHPLAWGTRYWWKVLATGSYGGSRWSSEVFTFRTMTLGDANGSGRLDISDVVFLINYIFAQGLAPNPLVSGDMNCDGRINIGDAVYLVNYMFAGGASPCDGFPTMMPAVEFQTSKALKSPAE